MRVGLTRLSISCRRWNTWLHWPHEGRNFSVELDLNTGAYQNPPGLVDTSGL